MRWIALALALACSAACSNREEAATPRGVATPEIRVQVDSVQVLGREGEGENTPWLFGYVITLRNEGQTSATLVRRHWEVDEAGKGTRVITGDGVAGEQPRIAPGQSFTYDSFFRAYRLAEASGHYVMRLDGGQEFKVPIPPFALQPPSSAGP